MAEYIERNALLAKLQERDLCLCVSEADIKELPAADVAPVVHGRWVYDGGNEYVDHYHCDQCGAEIDLCNEVYTEPKPNYCPNCGAKLDKEADHAQ